MKPSSDSDDRPHRARLNLLVGSVLLVVGVVLLVSRWNLVVGVIFTFVGAIVLFVAGLFSWSRRDRSRG